MDGGSSGMAEIELPSPGENPSISPLPSVDVWSRRKVWFARGLSLVGLVLIGLCAFLWIASSHEDRLALGQTWIPALAFLEGDFKVHIEHVARLQAAGVDPYHKLDDWVCGLYPYPPMIGRLFGWVVLFDPFTASRVWLGTLGVLLAIGGFAAWRTRRELGLDSIPLAMIVALVLFSSPAIFVMERGQCDPLIILPMIAAAWLLRRNQGWADVMAGGLLGWTAWVKYYPGLAVVALIALGRRKGLAAFVVVAGLIGIVDFDGFRESVNHAKLTIIAMTMPDRYVHEMRHSLVENWELFSFVKNTWLVAIPGTVAAAILLLPAVFVVSRKVAKSADPGAVLYPYLLWLAALATFGLPYAIDYNLAILPIATLAVWDRRDRWWVNLLILASVAWSQPFMLPINGQVVLCLKLGAIYAVGACIASRASEIKIVSQSKAEFQLFRPAHARIRQPFEAISGDSVPGSKRS
jgi:hypothetical protein